MADERASFLGWLGEPGKGRALSTGEVKFTGMVTPKNETALNTSVDFKRVMRGRLVLGIAETAWLKADGETVYTRPSDLRVGLFTRKRRLTETLRKARPVLHQRQGAGSHETRRRYRASESSPPSGTIPEEVTGIAETMPNPVFQPFRKTSPHTASSCQVWGAPDARPDRHSIDRRAMRFLSQGRSSGTTLRWNRPLQMPASSTDDITRRAHRNHHGIGRAFDARTIVEAADIDA